jgi:hypothetical protein
MDGITRSRKASLGCASGKLLAKLPSSLANGSRAILGMYAHHEAVRTHAVPTTLSDSELSSSMVVRLWFRQCLQCDVHLCITIFLLPNLSSVVRLDPYPSRRLNLQESGTFLYQNPNVSTDQRYISHTPS